MKRLPAVSLQQDAMGKRSQSVGLSVGLLFLNFHAAGALASLMLFRINCLEAGAESQ